MSKYSRHSRNAFTLVELLVVIGIIAALIAMLIPVLSRARIASLRVQCSSNQRQIAMAILYYANEHGGYAPLSLYLHAPDDFLTNNYYTTWYNRFSAGQYMKVKTRGKDYNPSSFTEGFTSKFDPAVSFLYCTAYNHGVNSDLGIGVNVQRSARIFANNGSLQPQVRIFSVHRPTQMVMLADVQSGFVWEKYYYNEPFPNNGQPDSSRIAYRHGHATCVTFCDGHGETFQDTNFQQTIGGYQTGLHAAYLANQIATSNIK